MNLLLIKYSFWLNIKYVKAMNKELLLEKFGKVSLSVGMPNDFVAYAIPEASYYHAKGPWGIICIQEIQTKKCLLRNFLFFLQRALSFYNLDTNNRLQSLLNISGYFDFKIKGLEKVCLEEKEFVLFNSAKQSSVTTVYENQFCSILNAQYSDEFYADLLPYFEGLQADLIRSTKTPSYFKSPIKIARYTVHDAITAIWQDKYIPALQYKHVELRLESSLFTMFAQSYSLEPNGYISPLEKLKTDQAKELILKDLKIHVTAEEIAFKLNCSEGWLRKAFQKIYGVGPFQYLRRARMQYARDMILRGESLKSVALDIGMNPSNFPKEFKAFFGYTVTNLKKGSY